MSNEKITYILLATIGLFLVIGYKYFAKVALRQAKQINDNLPKWIPWPIRLSEKDFNAANLKWGKVLSLIVGTWLFFTSIYHILN